MIHYGKTPQGELQLMLTGRDVACLLAMIKGAGLEERRAFHGVRSLIEREFAAETREKPSDGISQPQAVKCTSGGRNADKSPEN